ncbi:hypothetical protein HRbin30_00277 [bacterium HR30]|nr:hypothetical protein HRbin30_00277 [bacterium HR30]
MKRCPEISRDLRPPPLAPVTRHTESHGGPGRAQRSWRQMRLGAIAAALCVALHSLQAAAVSPGDLALVLSADAETILVGEPVGIRLRVENKTNQDVEGDFYPSYEMDRVRIAISKDGGPWAAYVSKVMQNARMKKLVAEPVTIPGGGDIEGRAVIAFDVVRDQPAFPAPGMYAIQAVLLYDFYQRQLTSNTVTVRVREPTGADAEAWGFIRANGLAHLMSSEARAFPVDDAAIGKLRQLANAFPSSRYAAIAETALDAICAMSPSLSAVPAGCPAPTTCVGDCDGDERVTVEELVRGVNIALDILGTRECRAVDRSEDGEVTVDELVVAVGNALEGCGSGTP